MMKLMKMKQLVVLAGLTMMMLATSGCFSVVRLPAPHREWYTEDGERHVDYYESMLRSLQKDCPATRGLYPTIKMRVHATKMMYQPITPDLTGEELYRRRMARNWGWIPLTVIWVTSPIDAVVDTVAIPWDW